MKRILFSAAIAAALGAGSFAGFRALNPAERQLSDIELANVEALAEDYEIGSPGTNWKEYEITCEITSSSGWDFGIWGNKDEKTYTAKVKVCGYGSGSCLSPAGC